MNPIVSLSESKLDKFDKRMIRFSWFRKLKARLARFFSKKKSSTKEVEVYTPTIPKRELERQARIQASREAADSVQAIENEKSQKRIKIAEELHDKFFIKGMNREEVVKASLEMDKEVQRIYEERHGKE